MYKLVTAVEVIIDISNEREYSIYEYTTINKLAIFTRIIQ